MLSEHFVLVLSHDGGARQGIVTRQDAGDNGSSSRISVFHRLMQAIREEAPFMGQAWQRGGITIVGWTGNSLMAKHDGLRRLVQHLNYTTKASRHSGISTTPTKALNGLISRCRQQRGRLHAAFESRQVIISWSTPPRRSSRLPTRAPAAGSPRDHQHGCGNLRRE
jgi:hypothetical protein